MHGDQQSPVVETLVKKNGTIDKVFKNWLRYCFQHLVIDVNICRECVLCVGITSIYMCIITMYINIYACFNFRLISIFIMLFKNLNFNSDQSSNLSFVLNILYDIVRMQYFACLSLTWFFFSNT